MIAPLVTAPVVAPVLEPVIVPVVAAPVDVTTPSTPEIAGGAVIAQAVTSPSSVSGVPVSPVAQLSNLLFSPPAVSLALNLNQAPIVAPPTITAASTFVPGAAPTTAPQAPSQSNATAPALTAPGVDIAAPPQEPSTTDDQANEDNLNNGPA